MNSVPFPVDSDASTTTTTTSRLRSASSAVSTMRTLRRCSGRWTPGVSTKTICAFGVVLTPRIRVRVVCGLSETMATLVSTSAFSSVDLPALGRPTSAT